MPSFALRSCVFAAVVLIASAFDPSTHYVDGKINVHLVCHTYVHRGMRSPLDMGPGLFLLVWPAKRNRNGRWIHLAGTTTSAG